MLCNDKWKQGFFFKSKSNDCLCNRHTNDEHHYSEMRVLMPFCVYYLLMYCECNCFPFMSFVFHFGFSKYITINSIQMLPKTILHFPYLIGIDYNVCSINFELITLKILPAQVMINKNDKIILLHVESFDK